MSIRKSAGETGRLGIVIGGSGLVGGTIVNYFKSRTTAPIEVRAPSSKKLSIREPTDIRNYLLASKPDFVINAAIANINADEQLSFEVNYLGPINIAKIAAELNIPYIHISSAATLELGPDITEKQHKQFTPGLSNYTRSKLMAEKTLRHLSQNEGLDYTLIRLAAVYGNHDHKIQGIHRMLFSIADESMPVLFTKKGVLHSYSNCRKLPYFIHHILNNREEFTGEDYNFVDKYGVELADLIMTIKSYLQLNYPKEIYIPYPLAKAGKRSVAVILKLLRKFGLKANLPSELVFLKQFYVTQTLNCDKLHNSSFVDPFPDETIYSRLPELIIYYLQRWSHENLISTFEEEVTIDHAFKDRFVNNPEELLESIHNGSMSFFQTTHVIHGQEPDSNEATKPLQT
ncbi:NAD-dependent epimerase/dehydratase family protein [Desulfosediminicola flagellatus]|uniref:NAD-dependent epimerase/dehydratase family protein n=1 Tax=Desulfosediminicola flagellatus TaxID=2569541 RepID=UPI0010AD8AA2|nr:NAD(P)-dependent oxidoreductase [Desulfosediminicola flagellatus]